MHEGERMGVVWTWEEEVHWKEAEKRSADLCKLCKHGNRPLKKSLYFDGYQISL